jgi:hypothetical protein
MKTHTASQHKNSTQEIRSTQEKQAMDGLLCVFSLAYHSNNITV